MQFNFEVGNINEIIEETIKAMIPLVEGKGLKLSMKLDKKLPNIKFDKDKIVQVVTNLMNNAMKFTEKGGINIITCVENDEKNIKVSVKDTGPGMRKNDMHKLFQRFEQLEKLENKRSGGTGLGLAISKEIIDAHKGKIWAESTLGKGATFHFILPI